MNTGQQISEIADSLALILPKDEFIKANHDTTPEQKSFPYPEKPVIKSFFTGHPLNNSSLKPDAFQRYQTDWNLVIIIISVSVIAWIRYFYGKRFNHLLLAPFSKRFQNQLLREGDLFSERLSLATGFTYFISMALLIFQVHILLFNGKIPLPFNGLTFYLAIMALLIIYWFCKIMMMHFLGSVFKTRTTTREYLTNILILNTITTLLILPALVLIIYLKSVLFVYIALIIISLLFLFRIVKGFLTGLSLTKFSYVFLFVYLCSLEIVPAILVVKLSMIYYNLRVPVY